MLYIYFMLIIRKGLFGYKVFFWCLVWDKEFGKEIYKGIDIIIKLNIDINIIKLNVYMCVMKIMILFVVWD